MYGISTGGFYVVAGRSRCETGQAELSEPSVGLTLGVGQEGSLEGKQKLEGGQGAYSPSPSRQDGYELTTPLNQRT